MSLEKIIAAIDAQIAQLSEARKILTDAGPAISIRSKPGRQATTPAEPGPKKKRTMSPEARARIAEAQKRRWAKAKKG